MLFRNFPAPVKFICGFIYKEEKTYLSALKILTKKFGGIDFETAAYSFNFTHYYEKEMGFPLYRRFVSFEKLRDPSLFVSIKLFCIKIENKFSRGTKRTINIDPGYLNEAKLVLTTTKDYSHRIYVGKGIFEEVTLHFRDGAFVDFETTYPDFKTNEYKNNFILMRENYRKQIHKYAK